MSKRILTAAIIGTLGGLATIVGPALPWLGYAETGGDPTVIPPGGVETSISGFALDPFGIFFGVALAVAAAWLWAGPDARRAVAFIAPISVAIGTLCIAVVVQKENALYGGFAGGGSEATLKYGVYVTLAGAAAGLVAAVLGGWPARSTAGTDGPEELVMESTGPLPETPA